jgi:hypothetical protein
VAVKKSVKGFFGRAATMLPTDPSGGLSGMEADTTGRLSSGSAARFSYRVPSSLFLLFFVEIDQPFGIEIDSLGDLSSRLPDPGDGFVVLHFRTPSIPTA